MVERNERRVSYAECLQVGKKIQEIAGKTNLKRVSLELGE